MNMMENSSGGQGAFNAAAGMSGHHHHHPPPPYGIDMNATQPFDLNVDAIVAGGNSIVDSNGGEFSTYRPIRNHNNSAIDDFYQNLIKQSNSLSINTFRNDLIQHQVRSRAEASRQPQQPVIVNQILPGEEGRFLNSFLKQPFTLSAQNLVNNTTTLAEIELATAAASASKHNAHQNEFVHAMHPLVVPTTHAPPQLPSRIEQRANQQEVKQSLIYDDSNYPRSKKDSLTSEKKKKSRKPKGDITITSTTTSAKGDKSKPQNADQVYVSLRESELDKIVDKSNPLVFLSIDIDDHSVGTIIIELFKHIVPRTTDNFRQLCTGENGFGYHMSYFHRIIPGFVCQGGDFEKSDGTGGYSIYGQEFDDEGFSMTHNRPFLLSMANCGPNTNGSQFFITLTPCPHLDGKHVVFGHVIKGLKVIKEIERCGTESGEITKEVKITSCGQVE